MQSAASCVHWLQVVWESLRGPALSRLPQRKSYGSPNGVIGIECPTWLGNATTRRHWWATRFVLFKSARELKKLGKVSENPAACGKTIVVQQENTPAGCSKSSSSKAAANEGPRRTLWGARCDE